MKFSRGFKTTLLDGQKWKLRLCAFWTWTGFPGKTLLEILQIIGMATVVGIVGGFITKSVQEGTESIKIALETSKYTQENLNNYIEAIGTIITENKMNESYKGIAKAKTLTTLILMQSDPTRKNALLFFLKESDLCCNEKETDNKVNLLQGLKLPGIDLSKAELTRADLSNTDLLGAKLIEARLAGANLQGSNLDNADLSKAILYQADLSSTTEKGQTSATYAILKGAELLGANLEKINLDQANLEEADLSLVGEKRTNLRGASLRGASLERANLQGANLEDAQLGKPKNKPEDVPEEQRKNFRHFTNLRYANLKNANLTNANLTNADLTGADLSGATLEPNILTDAKLCKTTMKDGGVSNRDCWWNKLLNFVNLGESSSLKK
jgi:uncharacterized protein YjbI with pentapeptide repeats